MLRRRLPHLWPRRLRWRLALGFALTVALLLAVLTGAERVLLEQALVGAMRQNLEATVHAGLASQTAISQAALVPDLAYAKKGLAPWSASAKDWKPLKQEMARLIPAYNVTMRLPDLIKILVAQDQMVAMLDTSGHVLDWTSGVAAGSKADAQLRARAVLAGLMRQIPLRVISLSDQEWTGQIATSDGPYLVLLQPTGAPVLTRAQMQQLTVVLKQGSKTPADPQGVVWQTMQPRGLVVMVAHRLAVVEQTVRTVTDIGLGGALAVIILATLLSLLVIGQALRPLAAITRGAERLARGDYRHRVTMDVGSDEIGRLAAAFNRMAAAIAEAFATQQRFVADASHELRTPLTALRGYTDVLLMGVDEDRATGERVLLAMQEDLGRMSRLVDDLLTLARLDGGAALRLSPILLADLLAAAAHEGRTISAGRQRIVEVPVPGDLVVWGDRDRLRQVLSNLVGNACAYCPPGSTIMLGAVRCDDWAVVTVRDDGPGIPNADLARLGERFYRGDAARSRRTGGTGLGLAIARAVVEAHGGTLSIDSTPGVGTAVTVRVPLAALTPPRPPELPARSATST